MTNKNKIKAYTGYNQRTDTRYYNYFEIVSKLPEIGENDYGFEGYKVVEINPVKLDVQQNDDDVYNYDFYEVVVEEKDDDGIIDQDSVLIAIRKEQDDE